MFHPDETVSVSPRMKRFGKLPRTVMTDKSISSNAKVIYAFIAMHVFEGSVARIGQRFIGKSLGMSASTVNRCIVELSGGAHLRQVPVGHGKRSMYVLLSPVFGQKQGRETVVVSAPSGGRRLASVQVG